MHPRTLLVLTLMSSASACNFDNQLHGGGTMEDGRTTDGVDAETTANPDSSSATTETTTGATTGPTTVDSAVTDGPGEGPQTPEDTDSTSTTTTTTESSSVDATQGEETGIESGDTDGITQVWSLEFGPGTFTHLLHDADTGQLYAGGMTHQDGRYGAPFLQALRGEQVAWSWQRASGEGLNIGVTALAVGLNSTIYVASPGFDNGDGASIHALSPSGDLIATYGDAGIEVRSLKAHNQGWISVGGFAQTSRQQGMVGTIRRPEPDEPLAFRWSFGCDFDSGDNMIVDLLAPAPGRSDMIVRGHSTTARPWLQRCHRDASVSTEWPRRQAASGALNLGPDDRPASGSMIQDSQGQLIMFTAQQNSGMLMEFSAIGDWRWSQELDFSPMALAPGLAGSFYVAGSFPEGENAVRIVDHRDAKGELIWRHQSLSDDRSDNYHAVTTDDDSLVFVAGRWAGEARVMALRPE